MSQAEFIKDVAKSAVTVKKSFDAPLKEVWRAWTDSEMLDQWWGPEPWRAVTKSMNFVVGGQWHYYMAGPNGEQHHCRADYKSIEPEKSFSVRDCFCNQAGEEDTSFPPNHWDVSFDEENGITNVMVVITFESAEDMQKYVEMGFEQGFTIGLSQLDKFFAEKRSS